MQTGNLDALKVRIPFCTDSSSGGRPSDVHLEQIFASLEFSIFRFIRDIFLE